MLESLAAIVAKMSSIHWLSALGSSAVVAAIASIVRIVFSPKRGVIHGIGTFFGGVLVGTLVGYIVNDIPSMQDYSNAIVAAVSIGAREVVEWVLSRLQELKYMKLAYLLSDEKFKDYQERVEDDEESRQTTDGQKDVNG